MSSLVSNLKDNLGLSTDLSDSTDQSDGSKNKSTDKSDKEYKTTKTSITKEVKRDELNLDLDNQLELNIKYGSKTTESGQGFSVVTDEGVDEYGNQITDIDVDADLKGFSVDADLTAGTENTDTSKEAKKLLEEIEKYTREVNAEKFADRGALKDYQELFTKVYEYQDTFKGSKIDLKVDMGKLSDFAKAAEGLTGLVANLTLELKNIIVVNDLKFLEDFRDQMKKIASLYETITEFKTTIIATSKLEVPLSVREVAKLLSGVTDEIESTLDYLDYFTGISDKAPKGAELNNESKKAIQKAVNALDTWKTLADAQTQTGMDTDAQVQEIRKEIAKFTEYAARAETQLETLVKSVQAMGSHIQFQ